MTNRERAVKIGKSLFGDMSDGDDQSIIEHILDEAEARGRKLGIDPDNAQWHAGYVAGLEAGRAAGLEEAAKFTEEFGLDLFYEADLSLRYGTVMLAAFAVKIRGLIPLGNVVEESKTVKGKTNGSI